MLTFEEFNRLNEEDEKKKSKFDVGLVKQVIGWTLFAPVSLLRTYMQLKAKEKKIERMIDAEEDVEKRVLLRHELEDLKYEQIKARENIQKKQKKLDDKIENAKKDMTPEEKEKFKKELDKQREKLKQAEDEFERSKTQTQGFV